MVVREDRKEQIMDKAVGVFAELGYYKATTALVAKAAGVTQPYVFHFFKNKEELFNAVIDRAVIKIYETFTAVEVPADQLMDTMGNAFIEIMKVHREEILMVMQAHAISEPSIRQHVKEKFATIHQSIVAKFQRAQIPHAEAAASQFMGMGFLITVSKVLDLPQLLCFDDDHTK
ncbi:TetR/AcrR family transcriptional regulator [Paenibacillus sp. SYP-B3998]|uniref:TetR/AcrR family transcriptional regulator n=1 Tax=Paenibacillus sp. SYP-B3998 TaxID=2678564 RepID=A0A6G3ZVY9_9BACL|nr:TetR/AcrR family transcriptional regulator [Paenibacillus sp. SYP-B3998]NEW05741.1 TetR/AcrR family transcriptional regulator [Paenibacillus sp. SYP-B3998]